MSEEKKAEQDERVAFEAEWKRSGWGDADTKNQCFHFWQARAASTSANGNRFDPYRLKVAEECCERLMSACTDAGCPDGVRMDDWIRENIRSTSANVAEGAEAVDQWQVRTRINGQWMDWVNCTEAECADYMVNGECQIRALVVARAAPPAQPSDVAQGAETVATVKVYETYTGQNGWIEVTQEEYDRTKDKYEHRIRRVSAPPAQTALTDDARDALRYRWLRDRTDTRDQKPFIAIMSAGGISMWNDTSADDAIDAALTAAGEPK